MKKVEKYSGNFKITCQLKVSEKLDGSTVKVIQTSQLVSAARM